MGPYRCSLACSLPSSLGCLAGRQLRDEVVVFDGQQVQPGSTSPRSQLGFRTQTRENVESLRYRASPTPGPIILNTSSAPGPPMAVVWVAGRAVVCAEPIGTATGRMCAERGLRHQTSTSTPTHQQGRCNATRAPLQQSKRDISSLSPHCVCQGALSSSAVVPLCVPARTTN